MLFVPLRVVCKALQSVLFTIIAVASVFVFYSHDTSRCCVSVVPGYSIPTDNLLHYSRYNQRFVNALMGIQGFTKRLSKWMCPIAQPEVTEKCECIRCMYVTKGNASSHIIVTEIRYYTLIKN